ncbi:peptidase [Thiorhodococcus mannitoliphagus]|uniref:Peptidase n=1 Tax=Thiorhodococcus mannitoliphagus TaxID=329406 RepID=A0A6P1E0X4_9GAMM|nr:LexA family transcriptional regulator [Thiorhodococcus mannitoliphagus]NEX23559.1 peptidase [Thiorhodococcus mannitoliphagus]
MNAPTYLINRRTHLTWTTVSPPSESEAGVDLPLLGWVSAGQPIDAALEHETIQVPLPMARKASFALRVRGQSMVEDQIEDGDIIVVERRQTAENGDTVVALIHGEQVTLKRFYAGADRIRLQPANPEVAPLALNAGEIQILGVVTGLVRMGG